MNRAGLAAVCLLALAIPAGALAFGPAPAAVERSSAGFEIRGLHRNFETGTGKLYVSVPGPGDLFLEGVDVLPVARESTRAQTVRFPVVLTGDAKRLLENTGSATVLAKVTFTPEGGRARTKTKRLTLRAALPQYV